MVRSLVEVGNVVAGVVAQHRHAQAVICEGTFAVLECGAVRRSPVEALSNRGEASEVS